ncbi:hypothetical protein HK097_011040 [Rhizophlyctis rosea]|uniref:Uncharacterized protein n=1 Tax=Rhizophlyctis rosea TaxID=64517 RepID=A0AAD5X3C3_9FUNG|nr:hypothetical protein HK097_011040 [Rhizophlyctis rosea]
MPDEELLTVYRSKDRAIEQLQLEHKAEIQLLRNEHESNNEKQIHILDEVRNKLYQQRENLIRDHQDQISALKDMIAHNELLHCTKLDDLREKLRVSSLEEQHLQEGLQSIRKSPSDTLQKTDSLRDVNAQLQTQLHEAINDPAKQQMQQLLDGNQKTIDALRADNNQLQQTNNQSVSTINLLRAEISRLRNAQWLVSGVEKQLQQATLELEGSKQAAAYWKEKWEKESPVAAKYAADLREKDTATSEEHRRYLTEKQRWIEKEKQMKARETQQEAKIRELNDAIKRWDDRSKQHHAAQRQGPRRQQLH